MNRNHTYRSVLMRVVVLVFLVTLIGCSPALQTEALIPTNTLEPAPIRTETVAPTETVLLPEPTSTPVVLPPSLIQVEPVPNSILSPKQPLLFYFNQPMDQPSVEESFQIKPPVNGIFTWLDAQSFRFIPQEAYPFTTKFTVTIAEDAKASNGISLGFPLEFEFRSVDYLRVSQRLPEAGANSVGIDSAIMMTFNQPVEHDETSPITIIPEMDGEGLWVNDSTFIFYPSSPGWKASTQYSVQLNSKLTAISGAPLAPNYQGQDSAWSFTTDTPRLLSVEPPDGAFLSAFPEFTLTFNQPMDPVSVQSNLSLQNARGRTIEGEYRWNDDKTRLVFKPTKLIEPASEYGLILLGLATNQRGDPIKENFAARYTSRPQLELAEDLPETVQLAYDGQGTFGVQFNVPLAEGQNLAGLIDFSPAAKNIRAKRDDSDPSRMVITAEFKPGNIYFLGVSGELLDAYGRKMGKDLYKRFKTSDLPPSLIYVYESAGFEIRGDAGKGLPPIFVPLEDPVLPAFTANLRSLNVSSSALTVEQFIQMAGATNQDRLNMPVQDVLTWNQTVPKYVRNQTMSVEIPFAPPRKTPATGFYSLLVTSDDLAGNESFVPRPVLGVISQVQMIVKTDANRLIAWAYNMRTGEPVRSAPLLVYNDRSEILGGASTDENGVAHVDLPAGNGLTEPLFAVIWKPGHPDFGMSYTGWALSGVGWDQFQPVIDSGFRALSQIYTDRLQYEIGQTVYFRMLLASIGEDGFIPFSQQKNLTVNVLAEPEEGEDAWRILASIPVSISPYGTAAGEYEIPAGFDSGWYKLQIVDPDHPASLQPAEADFYVAPDSSKVHLKAEFQKQDWLGGEDIRLGIEGVSTAGFPMSEMDFRWKASILPLEAEIVGGSVIGRQQILLQPSPVSPDDQPRGVVIAEGEGKTDNAGMADLVIAYDRLMPYLDAGVSYKISLLIEPLSLPGESILKSAVIHPANYVIRVTPESWGKKAGEEIGFSIQTLDWDGAPTTERPLSASFRKVIWNPTDKIDPQSGYPKYEAVYSQVGSSDFQTDENGMARLVFIPSEPGIYQLQVLGDGAITEVYVWAGGEGNTNWSTFPNASILLNSERSAYQAGETARILIPNPFSGLAHALITVESDHILHDEVISFTGTNYLLELPIDRSYVPGVYIHIFLYGRVSDDQPDFRQGVLYLPVDNSAKDLNISLQIMPQRVLPGSEVTLIMQARDGEGRPVRGEFSFALVEDTKEINPFADKIDLPDGFYWDQQLGVYSHNSLAGYLRGNLQSPGGRKLDINVLDHGFSPQTQPGQQSISASSPYTAAWVAGIETDENGMAELKMKLPSRSAKWLLDVRGVSLAGGMGQAQIVLDAYPDVEITVDIPEQVHAGDTIRVEGLFTNRTDQTMNLIVSLEGNNFSITDTGKRTQQIQPVAGKGVKVAWEITALDSEQVDLKIIAMTMDQQNLAEVKRTILVLPGYAPTTNAFRGLLFEGEKQEVFGIPLREIPSQGYLILEISPSIPSIMLRLTEQMAQIQTPSVETIISQMLAIIEVRNSFQQNDIASDSLGQLLEKIPGWVESILSIQNPDGGWGWYAGAQSDDYLTAWVYYGLKKVNQELATVDPMALAKGEEYLRKSLLPPDQVTQDWQYDLLAFQYFALNAEKGSSANPNDLVPYKDKLSDWAIALLALTLEEKQAGNPSAISLIQDLLPLLQEGNTGSYWSETPAWYQKQSFYDFHTRRLNTAIILATMNRLNIESIPVNRIVEYLLGCRLWEGFAPEQPLCMNSYEAYWTVFALARWLETPQGKELLTGEPSSITVTLNQVPVLDEQIDGTRADTDRIQIPLDQIDPNLNQLILQTTSKNFILYQAQILEKLSLRTESEQNRGILIRRSYTLVGGNCQDEPCQPLTTLQKADGKTPYLVHLTLVVMEDLRHVLIVDQIPAGAVVFPHDEFAWMVESLPIDLAHPYYQGWGTYLLSRPFVSNGSIYWFADDLPAGTYTISYRLLPVHVGEFIVLPAYAIQYATQPIGGNSALQMISITP